MRSFPCPPPSPFASTYHQKNNWGGLLSAFVDVRRVLSYPTRRVPSGHLKAVVWGQPNLRLYLDRSVVARGPVGICRTVRYISLFVDEPEAFVQTLQKEISTHVAPFSEK